jgi:WhiB family transcriptional regulator, redox-sensing transcriptional regulator
MGSTPGRPKLGGTMRRRAASAKATQGQDWRTQAACRGAATLFYQADLERKPANDHRVSRAKAVCGRCPVCPQCAAYALRVAEPHGIWGGFTERDRQLLGTEWRRCANHRCTWVDMTRLQALLREIKAVGRDDHCPPDELG